MRRLVRTVSKFRAFDYVQALARVAYLKQHPLELPVAMTDQMEAAARENRDVLDRVQELMANPTVHDVSNMAEKIPAIMLGYYNTLKLCRHVLLSPRPLMMFPAIGLMYCEQCCPEPTLQMELDLATDTSCDMCARDADKLKPVMMAHGFVTLHLFLCLDCDEWIATDDIDTPPHFPIR